MLRIFFLVIITTLAMVHSSLGFTEPTGPKHIYKKVGDRELRLYVTKPSDWAADDRRPAIVFFHGGGWTGGNPGQFNEFAKYYATRGIVCFQVEYRLLDKKKEAATDHLHARRKIGDALDT